MAAWLGGAVFEDEGDPRIRFRIRDREAELEFRREGDGHPACSRIRVDLRGASPGSLIVVPAGLGDRLRGLFNSSGTSVGSTEFDRAFVVQASHPLLVRRLFAPEHRRRAMDSVWALSRFPETRFELNPERLIVQVEKRLEAERDILALIESARTWVGLLWPDDEEVGMTGVSVTLPAEARCPVCGSALRRDVVKCAGCRTPHHRECWEYAGECSTYACRERRFV